MKHKNVLILDLQYNQENLNYIKNLANEVYIIDDHSIAHENKTIHHFIDNLAVTNGVKEELKAISPWNYLGIQLVD